MTILYFTSTGNCMQVAKHIGGNLLSIPQMIKENRYHFEDDTIGLVFPIYNVGLPKIVKRFIEKADWKADYSFAIGTYGAFSGAAMINLANLAGERGIKFDYMKELLTVDNYLPGFDMPDQIAKLPKKKTEENLKKIVSDIQARRTTSPKSAFFTRAVTAMLQGSLDRRLSDKTAHDFIVNEKCTRCGVCSKVCPTGNISVTDKVMFAEVCEVCLGCVHHCPQNAIHLKNEKSTARFCNKEVTLKEIQGANNQL